MSTMKMANPLNAKVEPSFVFDVAPFFLPTLISMFSLLIYQMSGNAALAPWLVYVCTPIYNTFFMDDSTNLPKESERKFREAWMFNIPMWSCVFWCFAAWLYGAALFSG